MDNELINRMFKCKITNIKQKDIAFVYCRVFLQYLWYIK